MAEVEVQRGDAEWSKWNSARLMIEAALDRYGLGIVHDRWVETENGISFTGSRSMCEAVATALDGLGLDIRLHPSTVSRERDERDAVHERGAPPIPV
jgi:hypothetical protein